MATKRPLVFPKERQRRFRAESVFLRFTKAEKALLKQAAQSLPVATWARDVLLRAAHERRDR
jgi:hypothetical protein